MTLGVYLLYVQQGPSVGCTTKPVTLLHARECEPRKPTTEKYALVYTGGAEGG